MTLTLERSPFAYESSPVDFIPGYFVFNVVVLSDYCESESESNSASHSGQYGSLSSWKSS